MTLPQMTPTGIFHTGDARDMRRQVFSGAIGLTNGNSVDYVSNNGGYAIVYVETFIMAQHGSNGYCYRLDEISRYGHVPIHSTSSFNGNITFNGSNTSNVNSLSINPSSDMTANFHINVYYWNTETGTEVSCASGIDLIGKGV